MNEQTKAFTSEMQRGVIIDEFSCADKHVRTAVPVGAIGEPKVPPYSAD